MTKQPKILFKTNVNALNKVRLTLQNSQTMSYNQILLGETNIAKLKKVNELLDQATNILNEIVRNH